MTEPIDPRPLTQQIQETWADADLERKKPDLSLDADDSGVEIQKTYTQVGGGSEVEVLRVPLTRTPLENALGQKMVPVRIPEGVEAVEFKKVLSGAYHAYLEEGRLRPGKIAALSGVSSERVRAITATEEFGYAIAVRGVDASSVGTLTPQQDAVLLVLTDQSSKKSWGARLAAAGISQAQFNAWMKQPTFARRFSGMAEAITANAGIALVELGRKVGEGDLSAIKLQLEINKRHAPNQQAQMDFMLLLSKVQEILTRHLAPYPEVLQSVAAELQGVQQEAAQSPRVIEM